MFKLASLFVDIKANQDQLNTQLEGVKGKLTSMSVAIGTAAGSLALSAIREQRRRSLDSSPRGSPER